MTGDPGDCEFLAETVPVETMASRQVSLEVLQAGVADAAALVHRLYHRLKDGRPLVRSWERCQHEICQEFRRLLHSDGGPS
jgi:hypothetical protein